MSSSHPASSELLVERWQIWHSYATYWRWPIADIDNASRHLVASGLAQVALQANGKAWWKHGSTLVTADADFECNTISFSPNSLSPYGAECLKTALELEVARRHAFPGPAGDPPSYVRAFLKPLILHHDASSATVLYPQVLLDPSGVMLTVFRALSPPGGTQLSELIDQHVNLFQHEVEATSIPPGALRWFVRGLYGPIGGFGRRRRDKAVDSFIRDLEHRYHQEADLGDFSVSSIRVDGDLARRLRRPHDPELGLRFLGHLVEVAVGSAVMAADGVLARRHKRSFLRDFPFPTVWAGRPSIYWIADRDEPASAASRTESKKDAIRQLMNRRGEPVAGAPLPPTLRALDDYAVYANSALYLWLCEAPDAASEDRDPNHDRVVVAKQVQVEHAESLWARHLRIRELADQPKSSLAAMVNVEQDLWRLSQSPRESTSYGELRAFLAYVSQQHGVADVRAHIQEGLRLRAIILEERRAHRQQWFATLLSVLLGIGATETLTDRLVVPLLTRAGIPATPDTLWVNVSSLVAVTLLAGLAWYVTLRRKMVV